MTLELIREESVKKKGNQNASSIYQQMSLEERFWSYVNKKDSNECWKWSGHIMDAGYGRIIYKGNGILAHRLSYILHYGEPPIDKPYICHKCNNPSCVNPNHLYAGTQGDNIKQMFDENRANRKQDGENNNASKVTWKEVDKIRKLHLTYEYSQQEIADMFCVSRQLVGLIVNNKIWIKNKN